MHARSLGILAETVMSLLLSSPFYREGNGGSGTLSEFPKVAELVSGRAETGMQSCPTPGTSQPGGVACLNDELDTCQTQVTHTHSALRPWRERNFDTQAVARQLRSTSEGEDVSMQFPQLGPFSHVPLFYNKK